MDGYLRQSTASQSRTVGPFISDSDFKTVQTGLTIANTDIKLMANGAASANKNSGGGTHRQSGHYGVTFDATDTATVGELSGSIVVSGALPVWFKFVVLEEAVYDALFVASAPGYVANAPVNVAQFGGSNLTSASGIPEVKVASIANNAITAASINADAITAAKIADGAIDAATFAAGAINAAAIAADAITAAKIADGAIDAATFAAGAINAAAIAADAITDAKVASDVTIASVTGAVGSVTGAVGSVTGNVGGNVVGTVASVVGAVGSVTGNVGGNVTGSVGSVAAGGIAAASFAAGAIDAAAIAANAIGASELASDAAAEIAAAVRTELATELGRVDAAVSTRATQASVDTVDGIVDAILVDTAEIGTAGAGLTNLGDTRIGNLDATVSSRASAANLATVAGYLDTEIASILATTDKVATALELDGSEYRFTANALEQAPTGGSAPTAAEIADEVETRTIAGVTTVGTVNALAANSVNASALAADAVAEIQSGLATASALATVAGYIDTEVGAIKAKTDNLPASPAATGDIPTAAQNADKLLGRNLAGGADGGRTVQDAFRSCRNRVEIVGGAINVYLEDDATLAWTGTATKAAGDPLVAIDPA